MASVLARRLGPWPTILAGIACACCVYVMWPSPSVPITVQASDSQPTGRDLERAIREGAGVEYVRRVRDKRDGTLQEKVVLTASSLGLLDEEGKALAIAQLSNNLNGNAATLAALDLRLPAEVYSERQAETLYYMAMSRAALRSIEKDAYWTLPCDVATPPGNGAFTCVRLLQPTARVGGVECHVVVPLFLDDEDALRAAEQHLERVRGSSIRRETLSFNELPLEERRRKYEEYADAVRTLGAVRGGSGAPGVSAADAGRLSLLVQEWETRLRKMSIDQTHFYLTPR